MTSAFVADGPCSAASRRAPKVTALIGAMWRHAAASDINGLATELALRSFLAFIPFFVVVATGGGLIGAWLGLENPVQQALDLLGESLSPEVSAAIRTELEQVITTRPGGLFGGAVLGAIILGGSAGASVLKGINRAYDLDEKRPWWKRWLLGLGIALLAEGVLCLCLAALVGAQALAQIAASSPDTPGTIWRLGAFSRWPFALLVLLLQAALVYRIAPCGAIPWRWVTPGAIVFAVGWLCASALFALYADLIGAYTLVFGVLGGMVVLLVWFQITAYALLIGAELNAAVRTLPSRSVISARRVACNLLPD